MRITVYKTHSALEQSLSFTHSILIKRKAKEGSACRLADSGPSCLKVDLNSCKFKVTYNDLNLTLIVIIAVEHNIIACLFSDTVLYR